MAICPCWTAAFVCFGQRGVPSDDALAFPLPWPLCLLGGSAMAGSQPMPSGILITAVAPNLRSVAIEHSQCVLQGKLEGLQEADAEHEG
eukprot:7186358-Heterocapsa_arctica.AAC.1